MPVLRKLGIIGWDHLEIPILAGIVTGDPILMIGTKGENKSGAIRTIAKALGEEIKQYDASKALFEDIMGIPAPAPAVENTSLLRKLILIMCKSFGFAHALVTLNTHQLKEILQEIKEISSSLTNSPNPDEIIYLKTPLSLTDDVKFLFIDEISRCNPQMQNKWFELVRDRKIMGMQTSANRAFAAMNPDTYAGSNTLDEAFMGRFAFFLPAPKTVEMELADIEAICRIEDSCDAPVLKKDTNFLGIEGIDIEQAQKGVQEIRRIVADATGHYSIVQEEYEKDIVHYLALWGKTLYQEGIEVDGRRLSTVRRNIIAALAVKKSMQDTMPEGEDLSALLLEIIQVSLPEIITGDIDTTKIYVAHKTAAETIESGSRFLFKLNTMSDPVEIAKTLKEEIDKVPLDWQTRLVERIVEKVEKGFQSAQNEKEIIRAISTVLVITRPVLNDEIKITAENKLRLLESYKKIISGSEFSKRHEIKSTSDARAFQKIYDISSNQDPQTAAYLSAVTNARLFGNQSLQSPRAVKRRLESIEAETRNIIGEVFEHGQKD